MLNSTNFGRWITRITLCLGLVAAWPANTGAMNVYILSDDNSSASLGGGQSGLDTWTVDGRQLLDQSSLDYRVGRSGSGVSIDALGSPHVTQPDASTLEAAYAGRQFGIEVSYALAGGPEGSGASSLTEQITIQNLTSRTLDFHLFQTMVFDVAGTVQLLKDSKGLVDGATLTGDGFSISEIVNPPASSASGHGAAGLPKFSRLGDALLAGNPDCSDPSATAGWVFEWDRQIAPNGTLMLESGFDLVPVPEPATASLLFAGLAALALGRSSRAV
jgi:hypothetical protein